MHVVIAALCFVSQAYRCYMCDLSFTTKGSLKRHCSVHSEDRPFMCPYCQKTFKRSVYCKKHMKIHKTEIAMQVLQVPAHNNLSIPFFCIMLYSW